MSLVISHNLFRPVLVASLTPPVLLPAAEVTATLNLADFWGAAFETQRNALYSANYYLSGVEGADRTLLNSVQQMAACWEPRTEPSAASHGTLSRLILEWNRLQDQVMDPAGEGLPPGSSLPAPRPLRKRSSITMQPVVPPPETSVAHPILAPSPETAAGAIREKSAREMEMEAQDNVDKLRVWLGEFGKLMAAGTTDLDKAVSRIDLIGDAVVTPMADLQAKGDPIAKLFWEGVLADAEIQSLWSGLANMDVRTAIGSEEHAAKWNRLVAIFRAAISRK